jgi:hypothetical protein
MKRTAAAIIASLVLATTTAVHAEPPGEADRPWAAGVSADERERALALFQEGNGYFAQSEYAEAARRYREALGHWDHPAIRGNLAVALINLDAPLEAYTNLEAALRFGAAPFESNAYQQLVTHQKLLAGRVAHIEIACPAQGASVALDGAQVLACPGQAAQLVLVGPHQIVARKRGHLTFTRDLDAMPGATTSITIVLQPLAALDREERRWPTWRPWAIMGAGVLVGSVGLVLELDARDNMDAFEAENLRSCPDGCERADLPEAVWGQKDRAEREDRWAIGAFAVGGAALVTGAVLLWMNQPERVRLDEEGKRVSVIPHAGSHGWGVSLDIRF